MNNTFGNYIIEKEIGQGSFAIVQLGRHIKLNKKVAIKRISKKKINLNNNHKRCFQEINILKTLKHPNIIRLYDVIEQNDSISIIMEYANKGDLYSVVQSNGRFSEKQARHIFRQTVQAIEFAHHKGIAHRDLKLENMLLNNNNQIKLADFGLSSFFQPGEFMNSFRGTIRYADPEILKKKPYSGEQADIWALGIILYCLLCGDMPFEDDILGQLFKKVIMCDYYIPEYVSENAKDLIQSILQVNVNQRITLAEIKNHRWFIEEKVIQGLALNFKTNNLSCFSNKIDDSIINLMKQKNYNFYGCSTQEDIENAIVSNCKPEHKCFVVDYEIMLHEKKILSENNGIANRPNNSSVFKLLLTNGFQNNLRNALDDMETFINYFQYKQTKVYPTYFGFISNYSLKNTLERLIRCMNFLSIKIEVEKDENFYFQCNFTKNKIPKTHHVF